jgi:hypothetical protein
MPLAGIQLIVHCIVLSSNAAPIAGGLARLSTRSDAAGAPALNPRRQFIAAQQKTFYTRSHAVIERREQRDSLSPGRLSPPPPPLVDSAQGSNALGFFLPV